MEKLVERVAEVLVSVSDKARGHIGESGLVSKGILDSLDIMNLIMELEAVFDIEIDPEDVLSDNFESVESIARLVEKCQG